MARNEQNAMKQLVGGSKNRVHRLLPAQAEPVLKVRM
jgi:hypothetical protein